MELGNAAAYIVMAYVVMAYIVMACIVMAPESTLAQPPGGLYSYGL